MHIIFPAVHDLKLVMRCDAAQLSCCHNGSSTNGDSGPLFPPLHVNDAGKTCLKAPPRNKMALFEQLTVPCFNYTRTKSSYRGNGTTGFHTCTQYAMAATATPAVVLDCGTGGIGKLSYGLGVSLSTCSGVVDADVSLRSQLLEAENDTCFSLESKACAVREQDRDQSEAEELRKDLQGINLTKVEGSSALAGEKDLPDILAVNQARGFHKRGNGFAIVGKLDFEKVSNSMEHPYQEKLEVNEEIGSAVAQQDLVLQSSDCKHINNINAISSAPFKDASQGETHKQRVAESVGTALKKQELCYQREVPSISEITPVSSRDSKKVFLTSSLRTIIKPKDVIHAVGQQLFWKARKAILRQQEIFASQVFELHKLIEVQRLLAKMPSTMIRDPLPSPKASRGGAHALYPTKGNFKQQVTSIKGTQQTSSRDCEGQAHEPKPLQKLLSDQDREARAELQQTKRRSLVSALRQSLTNGPCSQAPHPSCSEGSGTWGYPVEPLHKPFLYPSGVSPFPSGSGVGAAYVLSPGPPPPLTPFPFPSYARNPEKGAFCFGFNNQWPTPLYHGSVFALSNDWFAISRPSQNHLASRSEKPRPANSVPSINMKAEASSQSAKFAQSMAAASLSTQSEFASQKPVGPDSVPGPVSCRVNGCMPHVWESCRGENSVLIKELGALGRGEHAMDRERSCQKYALDLFPLQPSSSAACARDEVGCGRLIKAIPRSALAASESAALILRSIQRERQL